MKPLYSRLLRLALVGVAGLALFLCFALACAFVYVAPHIVWGSGAPGLEH